MNPDAGRQRRMPTSTTTPLVVNGVLYLGTPYGRVVALDADHRQADLGLSTCPGSDQPPFRGMAYWPGDGQPWARASFSAAPRAS